MTVAIIEVPVRLATPRDVREFLAAKKRKGEKVRWTARGVVAASYVPPSSRDFESFRARLRAVADWGPASERLDALEHALRARHGAGLPLPRKLLQKEDRSLAIFWDQLSCRCMVDGFGSLIGGRTGAFANDITPDFLDALGHLAKLQARA